MVDFFVSFQSPWTPKRSKGSITLADCTRRVKSAVRGLFECFGMYARIKQSKKKRRTAVREWLDSRVPFGEYGNTIPNAGPQYPTLCMLHNVAFTMCHTQCNCLHTAVSILGQAAGLQALRIAGLRAAVRRCMQVLSRIFRLQANILLSSRLVFLFTSQMPQMPGIWTAAQQLSQFS